jgi:hypothetical protein
MSSSRQIAYGSHPRGLTTETTTRHQTVPPSRWVETTFHVEVLPLARGEPAQVVVGLLELVGVGDLAEVAPQQVDLVTARAGAARWR